MAEQLGMDDILKNAVEVERIRVRRVEAGNQHVQLQVYFKVNGRRKTVLAFGEDVEDAMAKAREKAVQA
jgi:hypothetical protein